MTSKRKAALETPGPKRVGTLKPRRSVEQVFASPPDFRQRSDAPDNRILYADENATVVVVGQCVVIRVTRHLTDSALAVLSSGLSDAVATASLSGLLFETGAASSAPTMEQRSTLATFMKSANFQAVAYVIAGSGFQAAMMRSVFTAVTMMGRPKVTKVFQKVSDGALWLANELCMDPDAILRGTQLGVHSVDIGLRDVPA